MCRRQARTIDVVSALALGVAAAAVALGWVFARQRVRTLNEAVVNGDLRSARAALALGGDPNSTSVRETTPLAIASARGDLPMMSLLLDCGADADRANSRGWTALKSAWMGGNVAAVRLLLSHGARTDVTDRQGITLLMLAAMSRKIQILRLLLDRPRDLDRQCRSGHTALMYAAICGNQAGVDALLRAGANPALRNSRGQNAYELAIANHEWRSARILQKASRSVDRVLRSTEVGHVPSSHWRDHEGGRESGG